MHMYDPPNKNTFNSVEGTFPKLIRFQSFISISLPAVFYFIFQNSKKHLTYSTTKAMERFN